MSGGGKKHKGHADHHGGAWKVAYADFVTAMMAFFMVLWLVNQSQDVKQAVGGYFRDPIGFSDRAGGRSSGGAEGFLDGTPAPLPGEPAFPQLPLPGERSVPEPPQDPERMRALLEEADQIRRALEAEGLSDGISELIEILPTDEGLRIELMESEQGTFFEKGGAELAARGSEVLAVIAAKLASLRRDVVIEGHTDSLPYSGGRHAYSNWELSAARANAARRVLEAGGVASERIQAIRGFASRQPRFEDGLDPRNRRVTILVLDAKPGEAPGVAAAAASP